MIQNEKKIQRFFEFYHVFNNLKDIFLFKKILYKNSKSNKTIKLRVREVGNKNLFLRPNTSDAEVLWSVFHNKYHIPPREILNPSVIIDLGSNVGYTTAHFSWLFPQGKIFGLEMDRTNYELSKKNLESFPNVFLFNYAVWSSDGEVYYNRNAEKFAFHAIPQKQESCDEKIQAKSLNSFLNENNIKHIDYLKMDIEGAEVEIFESDLVWCELTTSMKVELHPERNIKSNFEYIYQKISKKFEKIFKDDNHPNCLIALNHVNIKNKYF